jgi:DNA-binding NtrC family response regulator
LQDINGGPMPSALLADRFPLDREGRRFDLATGIDVTIAIGPSNVADRHDGSVPVDAGHLDGGEPFVALASANEVPTGGRTGHETWARLAAEAIEAFAERGLCSLGVEGASGADARTGLLAVARQARFLGCVPVSLDGLRRLPSPAVLSRRSVVALGWARADPARDPAVRSGSGDEPDWVHLQLAATVLALSGLRANVCLVARADGPPVPPRVAKAPGPPDGTWRPAEGETENAWWPDWHAAERSTFPGAAWRPATARLDRQLQALRGLQRRRGAVDGYLRSTTALASSRLERIRLEAAARIAREARAWRGWWGQPSALTRATVRQVLALQEMEQRALIELAQTRDTRAELEGALCVARLTGCAESEVQLRASLAAFWRGLGVPERAMAALGPDWPRHASADAQLRWGHEALWAALLEGRWSQAADAMAGLRTWVLPAVPAAEAAVAADAALFYHFLGDRRAREAELDAARRGRRALSALGRARLGLLDRGCQGSPSKGRATRPGGRRFASPVSTAFMRVEFHHMDRGAGQSVTPSAGSGALERSNGRGSAGDRSVEDLLELFRICQADEDERRALGRACECVRQRLGASAVGIWTSASPEPMAGAGSGRAWPAEAAERACLTGMSYGPEAAAGAIDAAWPLTHGGATVGAVACRWLPHSDPDRERAGTLLTAAAAACMPLVRTVVDRRSPPVAATAFGLIGDSRAMRDLRAGILRAADVPYHVLVEGESGSGKELVARGIHEASRRRHKRLCAVNCAALTDDLLEAELFGHARGAFTGALAERAGLFEDASGGTLLLDEVADLSPRGQAKVLRVLQDAEVRRIGENFPRKVDVRIVAATNKPLRDEVTGGRFREDLRYRLDVLRLVIPPLRERREDVPLLALHFWEEAASRVRSRAVLDGAVLGLLSRHDWPGNVRELQNVIARLVVQAPPRGRIGPSALPDVFRGGEEPSPAVVSLEVARRRFEADYVKLVLARSGGRRVEAARLLGVTRQGLAKLLVRLGLES